MTRRILLAIAAVAIACAAYWYFSADRDEKEIRDQLERLEKAVRVEGGGVNPVMRFARLRGDFDGIFDKVVKVEIPELSAFGAQRRDELAGVAAQGAQAYEKADVRIGDVRVEIDPSRKAAHVTASATLTGARHGGERVRDVRKTTFDFDKREGGWRIAAVTAYRKSEGVQ